MNVHGREFLGCEFGDSYYSVLTKIHRQGISTKNHKGRLFIFDGARFAGLNFNVVYFEFSSNKMNSVTFVYENKDYAKVCEETKQRLTNKYGEGLNSERLSVWIVDDTRIVCGDTGDGFMLIYKDVSFDEDSEL